MLWVFFLFAVIVRTYWTIKYLGGIYDRAWLIFMSLHAVNPSAGEQWKKWSHKRLKITFYTQSELYITRRKGAKCPNQQTSRFCQWEMVWTACTVCCMLTKRWQQTAHAVIQSGQMSLYSHDAPFNNYIVLLSALRSNSIFFFHHTFAHRLIK